MTNKISEHVKYIGQNFRLTLDTFKSQLIVDYVVEPGHQDNFALRYDMPLGDAVDTYMSIVTVNDLAELIFA